MWNRQINRQFRNLTVAFALLSAGPAFGALTLGTDWGDGSFTELGYGNTGQAFVFPFLYVDDFGDTDSPQAQANLTADLSYQSSVSGLDSSLMQVSYRITNTGASAWNNLRFMVDVEASDATTYVNDVASAVWGAKTAGDPDQWQVYEYDFDNLFGLRDVILINNGLDGTDACGGADCDVDLGLQWNANLGPGEKWEIVVGLSDDASILSNRYLEATSSLDPATQLTFSGSAEISAIPLPGALIFLGSALTGLLGFFGFARRVLGR